MERAIATSEFLSKGGEEKIVVVLDFATFYSSLAPPLASLKALASILQNCYSERLKRLIILDPPFWMRTMYGLLKPFLDPVTKAKFVVASGEKKKISIVKEVVNVEQAMPFLLPDGMLVDEVDMERFLRETKFCLGFGNTA
jgi:hypothetical protein